MSKQNLVSITVKSVCNPLEERLSFPGHWILSKELNDKGLALCCWTCLVNFSALKESKICLHLFLQKIHVHPCIFIPWKMVRYCQKDFARFWISYNKIHHVGLIYRHFELRQGRCILVVIGGTTIPPGTIGLPFPTTIPPVWATSAYPCFWLGRTGAVAEALQSMQSIIAPVAG